MKFKALFLIISILFLSILPLTAASNTYVPQFDMWIQPLNGEAIPLHYFTSLQAGQEYSLIISCYYRKNKISFFGPDDIMCALAFLNPLKMNVIPTSNVTDYSADADGLTFIFRAPIFKEARNESDRITYTFKLVPYAKGEQQVFLYHDEEYIDDYYSQIFYLNIE